MKNFPVKLIVPALLLTLVLALLLWLTLSGALPGRQLSAADSNDDANHSRDNRTSLSAVGQTTSRSADQQVARGAYLARAGNCIGCHTARGGPPYAGGRAIDTPFGKFFGPNITADKETGIGNWRADDFWQALHFGKAPDGSLLYPVFPYPNYTLISRQDADALFAFLQTVKPVHQPNQPHALHFPYNLRGLLAGWRLLYFEPKQFEQDLRQSDQWNRGAYLVDGLGHCSACHTARNGFGANISRQLGGGMMANGNWYAPALTSDRETGLRHWSTPALTALLQTGTSAHGAVFGPMAEVVGESLQYLHDDDIAAIATYLKSLPEQTEKAHSGEAWQNDAARTQRVLLQGQQLYEKHCAECHGSDGNGKPPAYPPLNGNPALTMDNPVNPLRLVLNGGFAPSTAGNPRPYGMPPFGQQLNDEQVAALVSYIRHSWSNRASLVSPQEVNLYRNVPLD